MLLVSIFTVVLLLNLIIGGGTAMGGEHMGSMETASDYKDMMMMQQMNSLQVHWKNGRHDLPSIFSHNTWTRYIFFNSEN